MTEGEFELAIVIVIDHDTVLGGQRVADPPDSISRVSPSSVIKD